MVSRPALVVLGGDIISCCVSNILWGFLGSNPGGQVSVVYVSIWILPCGGSLLLVGS